MIESAALRTRSTALLLGLAAVAWVLTVDRMDGMDAGPGTELGGLGWFVVGWALMMAAMMLPSFVPSALAHARAGSTTALFAAGYLGVWAAAGLLGYAIVEGGRSLDIGFLAWDEAGPAVAGGVILGAAAYQLSPLKRRCLRHCRGALREQRRPGRVGAARAGIEHGARCVGCCWALMAALFALGVMSIGWMAFVAALIAAEKLLPRPAVVARGVAVVLVVLGLAVAFAPEDVPGLTIPGSSDAMPAMEAM